MDRKILTSLLRFTLSLMVAVTLIYVAACYTAPDGCCLPVLDGSCDHQSAALNEDAGTQTCLSCLLEIGPRYQQPIQAALQETTSEHLVDGLAEEPSDPVFGLFRPPIFPL